MVSPVLFHILRFHQKDLPHLLSLQMRQIISHFKNESVRAVL